MTGRILHISDLHLGRGATSEPLTALRELDSAAGSRDPRRDGRPHPPRSPGGARAAPASSSRASLSRFSRLPGNHDIPYVFPTRFTRTREEWERVFGTAEPVYTSERLAIVGLNSVRPWRQQGGAVERSQLDRLASTLERAPAGALRMVALHHHLASPPWRAAHKRPLRRRDLVLQRLASAGAELVLSGHVHQSAVTERREFEAVERDRLPSLVLATAPGFGRPRPQRRGEAVGFNFYESRRREHLRRHVVMVGPDVRRGRSAYVSAGNSRAPTVTFLRGARSRTSKA